MSYDPEKQAAECVLDVLSHARNCHLSDFQVRELMIALDDEMERRKLVARKIGAMMQGHDCPF